MGDFRFLNTTIKTSVVDVVNEVGDNIGNLSWLGTTDKRNTVSAINEINTKFETYVGKPACEVILVSTKGTFSISNIDIMKYKYIEILSVMQGGTGIWR